MRSAPRCQRFRVFGEFSGLSIFPQLAVREAGHGSPLRSPGLSDDILAGVTREVKRTFEVLDLLQTGDDLMAPD